MGDELEYIVVVGIDDDNTGERYEPGDVIGEIFDQEVIDNFLEIGVLKINHEGG